MAGTEGAKFWLHVITELHNRGVQDVFIACCDGLKGFPEAIEAVFPYTVVQTCVVHMIRSSLRFVAWGNRKGVARSLRPVYRADKSRPDRRSTPSTPSGATNTPPSRGPGARIGSGDHRRTAGRSTEFETHPPPAPIEGLR
jgi:hypothetical protein